MSVLVHAETRSQSVRIGTSLVNVLTYPVRAAQIRKSLSSLVNQPVFSGLRMRARNPEKTGWFTRLVTVHLGSSANSGTISHKIGGPLKELPVDGKTCTVALTGAVQFSQYGSGNICQLIITLIGLQAILI